jgi:hypothetical protein
MRAVAMGILIPALSQGDDLVEAICQVRVTVEVTTRERPEGEKYATGPRLSTG